MNNKLITEAPKAKQGLSKVAKVAIIALIAKYIGDVKKKVTLAYSTATDAKSNIGRIEKQNQDLKSAIDTLSTQIKNQKPPTTASGFDAKQLDKIRKMIRLEVGRIYFDIYKLRASWINR